MQKTTPANKYRRKLAFKIAEELERKFITSEDWNTCYFDVDEAMELIASFLPSTYEELEKEEEELNQDLIYPLRPKGPSQFQRLKEAVHATSEMSLKTVLEAAIEKIERLEQIEGLVEIHLPVFNKQDSGRGNEPK